MKKYPLLFCFLCLLSKLFAQFTFPTTMRDEDIVATCFDTKWDDELNACFWKPNFYDQWKLFEKDTEALRIEIDTAFGYAYKEYKSTIVYHRIILLYSFGSIGAGDCHACAPLMSLIFLEKRANSTKWELKNFNKYAPSGDSWGRKCAFDVIEISADIKLLTVKETYSQGGEYYESMDIYAFGEKVLSFETYYNNSGLASTPEEKCAFSTEMSIDKEKQQIRFHRKGTEYQDKYPDRKIVPVNEEKVFQFAGGKLTELK